MNPSQTKLSEAKKLLKELMELMPDNIDLCLAYARIDKVEKSLKK